MDRCPARKPSCSHCNSEHDTGSKSSFCDGFCSRCKWCLLISSKRALKSTQRSTWKFWKMFWCRGYVGTTTPFKVMLVQDSEPVHGAKKVQDFLKENLPLMVPKDIWPSSSPDLNVCDYWLFGVIEGKSNVTSHPSVNSLKASIRRAFRNLDPEDVKRSCSRFRSRISQIIDTKQNGSHIEWFCSVDNNEQINK